MKIYIENRVKDVARYIIETKSTIRKTAEVFGVSKDTIHLDITTRLKEVSPLEYPIVNSIIMKNKEERSSRGGKARRGLKQTNIL